MTASRRTLIAVILIVVAIGTLVWALQSASDARADADYADHVRDTYTALFGASGAPDGASPDYTPAIVAGIVAVAVGGVGIGLLRRPSPDDD